MKNIIISKCVKNFLTDYKIREKDESVQFEHFSNYCVFSKYALEAYTDNPDFYEYIHTGSGGDLGIDGVLILVNENEVNNVEQFKGIVDDKPFSVKFIFVQAKFSEHFDSGEMLKTMMGVYNILNLDYKSANMNDKIREKRQLIKEIYNLSPKFLDNPECYIYYVTTGHWTNDESLVNIKNEIEKNVGSLNLTSKVDFIPVDAHKLQQIYRNVTNSISKTIPLEKVVAFPTIEGVKEAFLGLVKIQDLIDLICDEDGIIQNALFYENVRGFLGQNPVNDDIKNTLISKSNFVHFPILNNGITIVAREMKRTGDNFRLSDFQIVNGCQTCNVIYSCKDKIRNKVIFCALKLICTEKPDVIVSITKSTNRQTAVTDEAFESLRNFHKELQMFYDSISDNKYQLYYERRAREFNGGKIDKSKIVSLTMQIKSFLSMFLLEPHSTHRYYGELLKVFRSKGRIFNDGDKLLLYYTSALCLHRVDEALSKNFFQLKKYRFHFVMIIGLLVTPKISNLKFNSNQAEKVANQICKCIKDDKNFRDLMAKASAILQSALKNMPDDSEILNIRKRDFTNEIKTIMGIKVSKFNP